MVVVRMDVTSAYHIRWPKSTAEILALGQTYIAYESNLPVEQRLAAPSLAQIEAAYTAVLTAHANATSGENSRAFAAETYRQTLRTARARLNVAIVHLKSKYIGNLARLESWGLETVMDGRSVTVRKPRSEKGWALFLAAYVAQEANLPEAERIADPSLAEMMSLNETLQAAIHARATGKNQRESNMQTRAVEVQRLLDLLQVAGLVLLTTRYDGVITNALQWWGYEVTAVTTPAREKPAETALPASPMENA